MALPPRLLAALALLAVAAPCQAGYRVDSWGIDRGLPQGSVTSVLQTRDGYLWLGTFGGLVRFDGVRFTVFEGGAGSNLRSNRILSLFEDRAGALWIGTERGGVSRYANGAFTTYTEQDGLPFDNVASIHEDARGRMWFATTRGVGTLENGRVRTYTTDDGLPTTQVSRITSDAAGDVWIATGEGLVRYREGRFVTEYSAANGLPPDYVPGLRAGRDGSLWLTTRSSGLARIRDGKVARYTTKDGLPSNALGALLEDGAGRLWIGSDAGLIRLDPVSGERVVLGRAHGLADQVIAAMAEDREGNLWVGTSTDGLKRVRNGIVSALSREEGLPGDAVVPVAEDAAGALWIGMTCGGLVRYEAGRVRVFGVKDGLPSDCIWSLLPRRDGSLWFGTWGSGVTRMKDGRFTTYLSTDSALVHNNVLALHEDRAGALWLGTGDGLQRLSDGQFRTWGRREGLVHGDVRFLMEARDGALWIGTSGGASRFKDGGFTNYTTAQGLSHNFVRAIHETDDGAVWFGTYGGGLNRLAGGRIVALTTGRGLAENIVSRILEDGLGYFWMTGNKGISRVARKQLEAVAAGAAASVSPVVFGVADGMKSSECNGGGQPAGWKDHAGVLWFPTARGVVRIDPSEVTTNRVAPPVRIEQVLVNGVPHELGSGELTIPPRASAVEIHYTGLSFSAPERVHFRYKLAGLDEAWTDAGTRRSVTFSHLPSGRYAFAVSAANADGVWNETGTRLGLRVVPPFYRSWWFGTLATLLLAVLVLGVHERRVRRLRAAKAAQEEFSRRLIDSQEAERKRIAAELHDSLSQTLAVIKNRALVSLQAPGDQRRALDQMGEIVEAATHALEEVKEISHDLRPRHLDRLGLTKAIEAMLDSVLVSRGIRVQAELDALDGLLPPGVEINVYRIAQEAVNNIVKHAAASEVKVAIRRQGRSVGITIEDNGRGFSPDVARSALDGFGLAGIAERARLLGTEPVIQSAPGRGTTLRITLAT